MSMKIPLPKPLLPPNKPEPLRLLFFFFIIEFLIWVFIDLIYTQLIRYYINTTTIIDLINEKGKQALLIFDFMRWIDPDLASLGS